MKGVLLNRRVLHLTRAKFRMSLVATMLARYWILRKRTNLFPCRILRSSTNLGRHTLRRTMRQSPWWRSALPPQSENLGSSYTIGEETECRSRHCPSFLASPVLVWNDISRSGSASASRPSRRRSTWWVSKHRNSVGTAPEGRGFRLPPPACSCRTYAASSCRRRSARAVPSGSIGRPWSSLLERRNRHLL